MSVFFASKINWNEAELLGLKSKEELEKVAIRFTTEEESW
jgi:hypothetical protein